MLEEGEVRRVGEKPPCRMRTEALATGSTGYELSRLPWPAGPARRTPRSWMTILHRLDEVTDSPTTGAHTKLPRPATSRPSTVSPRSPPAPEFGWITATHSGQGKGHGLSACVLKAKPFKPSWRHRNT